MTKSDGRPWKVESWKLTISPRPWKILLAVVAVVFLAALVLCVLCLARHRWTLLAIDTFDLVVLGVLLVFTRRKIASLA